MNKQSKHTPAPRVLRVIAHIGLLRPTTVPDQGMRLLEKLCSSRHTIAAVLLYKNDPLWPEAARMGFSVIAMPPELAGPRKKIHAALEHNEPFNQRFTRWRKRVAALHADIGLVFYGSWLPPALYEIPSEGFINYHPAPLPELRGMEPDTLAILEGRRAIWGTVHRVTRNYDEGAILERSARLRISPHDTPLSLFARLSAAGIPALMRALNNIAAGKAKPLTPHTRTASQATRRMAREASWIQWASDNHDIIHRRLRAFNGQHIGIRLKAWIGEQPYILDDLELVRGRFPGKPGDVLGQYRGRGAFSKAAVVRTQEGVAVARLGIPWSTNADHLPEPRALCLLEAIRRKPRINKRLLSSSFTGKDR